MRSVSVLIACVVAWSSQATGRPISTSSAPVSCSPITEATVDDCVRLNQIQVLGTHNSYHIAPVPAMLAAIGPQSADIEYTHRPLTEQLSQLGIRQFELDVFADPIGGRYATPAALSMVPGLTAPGSDLSRPGFKVLHTPDTDYLTTCATLVACLTEIRDWSRQNPRHVPIQIQIEAKDGARKDARFVVPIPIGAPEFWALDQEIRSVFDEDHLITPDQVRGRRATLGEAVKSDGWPSLGEARGKVLFALDNTDEHRTAYLQGNPALEGRVLFVSTHPGEPSAGFIKMNEALGEDEARIRQRVREGYLVRTRSDIPTTEARSGSTLRRDGALRSGAQYVSTDYPEPSPFGSGYIARLPGAEQRPARCNPVNAPAGCRDEWLEPGAQAATGPYPPWDVVVVAHRGLSEGLPENTLTAFRNVIARGIAVIELDLRGTADGEVVVLHDETVDRTTNGHGAVTQLTLREVRALDAGSHAGQAFRGERVPTYEEVLELVKGTGVHLLLDIKISPVLNKARVVRLTERYGVVLNVIAGVRNVDDLRELSALNPNLRTLGFVEDIKSIDPFVRAGADMIRLWPEWIFADRGLVGRVHALGVPVWTTAGTRPRADLDALIRLGVNGVLTDLPEVLAPLVADIRARRR